MEKKISTKVDNYIQSFKKDIKVYLDNEDTLSFNEKSNFLKFIYDYDNLSLDKDDFKKRKRVKSVVPLYLRCCAKRANGEQCTRKKTIIVNIVEHMIKTDHMEKLQILILMNKKNIKS